jgi:hypothetical protein
MLKPFDSRIFDGPWCDGSKPSTLPERPRQSLIAAADALNDAVAATHAHLAMEGIRIALEHLSAFVVNLRAEHEP